MALSGLQIQKLLPKTNCKECGCNTCLAFAMKLAAKKAMLSECPYVSEEAKQTLGADSEPPVKTLTLGGDDGPKIGGETVLYRHEKTFVNQTILAVNIDDTCADAQAQIDKIRDYQTVRVGETLTVDAIALTQKSGDDAAFARLVALAAEAGKPLILRASASAIAAAAPGVKGAVIAGVTEANLDAMLDVAKQHGHILSLTGADVDQVYGLSKKLRDMEISNFMLQFPAQSLAQVFQISVIARRAALKDAEKALGHPTLTFVDTGDLMRDTAEAVTLIAKYGGVVVLPSFDAAQLVTLMTLRQNIFTDPQKPIQMEPKLYAIGEPDENSPVFITTNFSLTYFIVSGEIENSGISAWLVIPDCEGFSVLTAWAAGKFSGAKLAAAIREFGLEEAVKTRMITIPGYVSQISGELEENLPGWKVSVGPQEASDLDSYIKTVLLGA